MLGCKPSDAFIQTFTPASEHLPGKSELSFLPQIGKKKISFCGAKARTLSYRRTLIKQHLKKFSRKSEAILQK